MLTNGKIFKRGVIAGIVLILLAQYLVDRGPFADWLVSPLLLLDTQGAADVIVVAGAGLVGACEPNLSAMRRVLKAATLWQDGRAPFVLFTGGPPRVSSCAVADVMADLAVRLGVPRDRILTEATSVSTRENAFYAVPVLESIGARHVLLVTDRLHMRRASGAFAAVGYPVGRVSVPVYATHRGNADMLAGALREAVALAYYGSRGWLGAQAVAPAPDSPPDGAKVQHAFPAGPLVILGASYAQDWPLGVVGGRPVINTGVEGQQSFELAQRFERDVLAHAPRAVVVWGFINDIFRADRPDIETALGRARDSISSMIARGREAGVEVILSTEVPIATQPGLINRTMALAGRVLGKTSYQDYVNGRVRQMNEWIRETARTEGLQLLDFERVVSDPDGKRRALFAQPDGSHLTDAAYTALTRYSLPILERRLQGGA